MKKIKLFSAILIATLILSSCSSDDSNSISIVGTWGPIAEVDVCSTGSEATYDYSPCEQLSRTIFSSNGTVNISDFDIYTGDDCTDDYKFNGTWTLNGNNLTILINGNIWNPTFFELTRNTLKIGDYDNGENDPCDGVNLPSHYYTEFTRVE